MDIHELRARIAERDTYSILETIDVATGARKALHEFDYVIEAPNWTQDGRFVVYNSRGRLYTYELATGAIEELQSGFAVDCNNDHVLSPDNREIAISHFTYADATSRIYILPFAGGDPRLTPAGAIRMFAAFRQTGPAPDGPARRHGFSGSNPACS